jgi:DNA-binding NtrC family response regulator
MTTIVLVDDEPSILKSLARAFRPEKWNILTYEDPEAALIDLKGKEVDLIISDYKMPGMSGVEFLNSFKQYNPEAIRLILSGQADLLGLVGAINSAQVFRFVLKPWNDEELLITIKQALEYNRLQKENNEFAQLIRSQKHTLRAQFKELKRLEEASPGITQVNWDDDGMIDLTDEYSN